ncbi:hypothetical protein CAPTEDRAFT_129236 [Capitella teleta]|uniref:Reverse transcriptase domain-containing protein n=1 Tax=Capitella teleta TaxID=283909 RepID=R7UXZ4_CAPTE|nr:hypothetical protein CAPTEDRAFT_129236 [Capitella teleta]|eukprot:ELU08817.1 hypothetical protein CAPTEDRAFT_129236 [Capitella teleta]
MDKWTLNLDEGKEVDVIYCDYMKVLDTVVHQRLLLKPKLHDIAGRIGIWLRNILVEKRQKV